MNPFSVYLAGPEVFWPNAHDVLAEKVRLCEKHGLIGLSPFDNEVSHDVPPNERAVEIYTQNIALMQKADAIIANISSFRGPNMDPGTAFEIGFFKALGKPVVLYSHDSHSLTKRVCDSEGVSYCEDPHLHFEDKQGHMIENFGFMENLMIDLSSKHPVAKDQDDHPFEKALKQLLTEL